MTYGQIHKKTFLRAAVFALALAFAPQPASAGFFEWLDNATTFNEDQRRPLDPDILPSGPPAPLLYDMQEARNWNQYYQRHDLEPSPYLDGSGTMVMRPGGTNHAREHGYVLDRNGNPIYGPNGRPVTGYEIIQRRAALNEARQKERRLYIGEPGAAHGGSNANLGVKTKIGSAHEGWHVPGSQGLMQPQPGDFDYNGSQQRTDRQHNRFEHTEIYTDRGDRRSRSGDRFEQHFPDEYVVRKGDTLTEISEQDQIYGDWKMWPLIYDANRSQISHPDLIYPEQRFGIPRDYTVDEAEDARGRSLPPYNWAR